MKKAMFLFLLICSIHQISYADEVQLNDHYTEIQSQPKSKAPDFSPPKDMSGPVFPIEDVIGEPNQDTNKFLNEFVNMLATLGLIISLILIVAWFLKRMLNTRQEQANTTSLIKVIERRVLSPKSVIYLLEIEGKSIVISESQNGVIHLADYDSPAEGQTQEIPSAFNQIIDKNKGT